MAILVTLTESKFTPPGPWKNGGEVTSVTPPVTLLCHEPGMPRRPAGARPRGMTPGACPTLGSPGRLEARSVEPEPRMIEYRPIRHHIFRSPEPTRLCDGQPSSTDDLLTRDIGPLREARAEATLCPTCQLRSGHRAFYLRPLRQVYGKQTLAYLHTLPIQNGFDEVRNCPHCREAPGEPACRAWKNLAKSVRVLQHEASLTARDVTELMHTTDGRPATLYRFVDGSVGYLAPDAPSWLEAD